MQRGHEGSGEGTPSRAPLSTAVVTWEDLLSVLDPLQTDDLFSQNYRQFKALVETRLGPVVLPFQHEDLAAEWRLRADDLWLVLDSATKTVTEWVEVTYPRQGASPWHAYRYYPFTSDTQGPWFAVGVRGPIPPHQTSAWLFVSQATASFQSVVTRVLSEAAPKGFLHEGDLYVPLEVPLHVASRDVGESFASEIGQFLELAKPTHQGDTKAAGDE